MLFLAAAIYVGSQVCGTCHTEIAEAYSKTPMARSSGRVTAVPAGEFSAAGHRYRVADNRLSFPGGSTPFDFFVGSNTAGRSFLFQREGYLYELPVTWYARKNLWDASPGYERESDVKLNRPIDVTCLGCHASRLQPVLGTQNRYGDPPFLDNGVGCERCHGPGSEHVQNPAASPLVNPAKLDPEERDSVCMQCHLTGEARIERAGRRFSEFRPGQKLSDLVTYFVWQGADSGLKATSHYEKLAASACKRGAPDKLWCGTCHEPHANVDSTQRACLSCHPSAHRQEQNCASCHMPKSGTTDAAHSVTTDHDIRRPGLRMADVGRQRDLVALAGVADDRALGLAYAEAGDARARQYLLRAQPADTPVLLRLAALERDPARAATLYEAVIRSDPKQTVAMVNLGALYGQAGRLDDARRLWTQALEANPAIEEAVLNLAAISPSQEARRLLARYLEFNPGSSTARKRASEIR